MGQQIYILRILILKQEMQNLAALKDIPVAMFVGDSDTSWVQRMEQTEETLAGLGKAMLREDKIALADEYINRALRISPREVHTHIARAMLAERQQQHDQQCHNHGGPALRQPIQGAIGGTRILDDMLMLHLLIRDRGHA